MAIISGINDVLLNTPTFHDEEFQPGLINFFYGKNGTGKSTAALKLSEPGNGVQWDTDTPPGTEIRLFNAAYIERNVHSYGSIPGVYALSEENVVIHRQIDETEKRKAELEMQRDTLHRETERLCVELEAGKESCARAVWRATVDCRKRYPEVFAEYAGDVEKLSDSIRETEPVQADADMIAHAYETGFHLKPYQNTFFELIPYGIFPKAELLDIPVISRTDSALRVFFDTLGSFDWAKLGHERYSHAAGGRCPYCSQALPDGFEQMFADLQDVKYVKQMQELTAFSEKYEAACSQVQAVVNRNTANPFRTTGKLQYPLLAEALLGQMEKNRILIRRKLEHPGEEVSIDDLNQYVERLNREAEALNTVISRHMSSYNDVPSAKKKAEKLIWQQMAWDCREILALDEESRKTTKRKISDLRIREGTLLDEIRAQEKKIHSLRAQTVNTRQAMETINRTLENCGFYGFRLRERQDEPNTYVLTRGDGEPAADLSEGERKFIAFLYFYHTVTGALSSDGRHVPQVVVIDDPVCSMDSEVMSFAATLVRDLIIRCREDRKVSENGTCPCVIQMFCFTHNPVFFRMISDFCIPDAESCFFYEIRKNKNNESTIFRCLKEKNGVCGGYENRSPVSDVYQDWWRQYRDTQDPLELLNVSRQILSNYFILTCHYSGSSMTKTLLEENRAMFADRDELNIASSLTALLDMGADRVFESMYFDVSAVDTERIRFVVKKIFDIMNQGQHYQFMMRDMENMC
ncbi:MAG: AAA family ATPase [Clostridia bacterium]|nr:AAA family ATPase [Clostridia bacterium]